jgi:hypothetical protein
LAKSTAKKAGTTLGEEALAKFGAKAGLEVGGALAARTALNFIPIVNTVMWAMTAYDLTRMFVPNTAKFAIDSARSYQGWGSRGTFGSPYKTNEASLTSRSRGVSAIQNSRLNARSILGSEAGGMHAYFG